MKMLAAAATLGLFATPVLAQETADRPSPEQIAQAVRYALPHLVTGVQGVCGNQLAADGFLARNGDAFKTRMTVGAEAAWPQAKSAMLAFAASRQGGDQLAAFADLPDEMLQPVVDGLIVAMISSELKPASCADVERGMELVAPLPPENIAGLVGFVMDMAGSDDEATVEGNDDADGE